MTLDIKDRLYTSSEVAEILGVSLRSVYRYLEEGKLDADIKTATGRHRFSKKNILDFLQPSDSNSRNNEKSIVNEASFPKAPTPEKLSTFSSVDTVADEFDFDNFFETDVVKKDSVFPSTSNLQNKTSLADSVKDDNQNYLDESDDLEKLFEELEKEFVSQNSNNNLQTDKQVSKLTEDEFDFNFDFLDKDENVSDYLKVDPANNQILSSKKNTFDDSDFDFLDNFFDSKEEKKSSNDVQNDKKEEDEFDFFDLDSVFEDSSVKGSPSVNNVSNSQVEQKDDSEGWLERFRKASEKVNTQENVKKNNEDFDLSSFFNNKKDTSTFSLKHNDYQSTSQSDITKDDFKSSREERKKEYYYISSLSGPKEIAQTIDKVSRKFDLDYAFTMNAGLSLHKDISPFTLIHVYINERDLEIFEDYLKLTPSSERDAHLCIFPSRDREIFEDSYELNGLFVVSNVQLRSDFIDKGMDNYAREI